MDVRCMTDRQGTTPADMGTSFDINTAVRTFEQGSSRNYMCDPVRPGETVERMMHLLREPDVVATIEMQLYRFKIQWHKPRRLGE